MMIPRLRLEYGQEMKDEISRLSWDHVYNPSKPILYGVKVGEFSEQEVERIIAPAGDYWNRHVGQVIGRKLFRFVEAESEDLKTGGVLIRKANYIELDLADGMYVEEEIGDDGFTVRASILLSKSFFPISQDSQYDESAVQSLVAHELGHAFMLGHSDNPMSNMFPSVHVGNIKAYREDYLDPDTRDIMAALSTGIPPGALSDEGEVLPPAPSILPTTSLSGRWRRAVSFRCAMGKSPH